MGRIDWDLSFSVNNDELDSQHKKLIDLYNELHESLLHGSIEETTALKIHTLNNLCEYIDYHFSSEEALLKEINYPDFDNHCQIHRAFSRQVKSFQNKIRQGELVFSTSLMKMLSNWILDHILKVDKAYAEHQQA